MRTVDDINDDLNKLWTDTFPRGTIVYAPMQYRKPPEGMLLFVGMNPSFSVNGWSDILRHSTRPNTDPHLFFQWPSSPDFNIEFAHELEAVARTHYQFFAPHRDLSKSLEVKWDHFDLFAYRETSQAIVRELVLLPGNDIELTEFGVAQFKLFEELLVLANPSAVVVVNALAARIYLKQRSPKFDSLTGYYRDSIADGVSFPVFFSGMLTGARALDRFSRERLFWQIRSVFRKI